MKIAVIGAGPGGLYAALAAARKNVAVDLFEKRNVGEGIVCGECLFDSLNVMPRPGEGLVRPVDEILLQGRRAYPFPLSRHRPLWMLDRRTWQRQLARRAAALGVRIHENAAVSGGRLKQLREDYDWILDASGAPSVTSRLYGFAREYFRDCLLAHQVVLEGDFGALWPRIKFAFFEDLPAALQPGYYWVFPKDRTHANVGVVCTMQKTPRSERPDLKKKLADVLRREGLTGASVLARGGGIATGRMLPRLTLDNIVLVGDAAGLTSALHGGGIDTACLSGALAVETLGDPKRYEEILKRRLREKNALERIAIRKMRTLSFEQYDRLLGGVTSPSRFVKLATGLRHLDMLCATLRWFKTRKEAPDWPA